MPNSTPEVTQSGDLYLVQRGDVGRLVDVGEPLVYPPARVTSILAHSAVSMPWKRVDPADVPELVRKAGTALPRDLPTPD